MTLERVNFLGDKMTDYQVRRLIQFILKNQSYPPYAAALDLLLLVGITGQTKVGSFEGHLPSI
jgi:hypothetical protein